MLRRVSIWMGDLPWNTIISGPSCFGLLLYRCWIPLINGIYPVISLCLHLICVHYLVMCWVIWFCVGLFDYVSGYAIMCWVMWLCVGLYDYVMRLFVGLCYMFGYVIMCWVVMIMCWVGLSKEFFKCMSAVICRALSARMCLLLLHDTMLNEVWECAKMTCHDATCWWMVLSPPETVIFNQVAEFSQWSRSYWLY